VFDDGEDREYLNFLEQLPHHVQSRDGVILQKLQSVARL
jgi:hypothetical protein